MAAPRFGSIVEHVGTNMVGALQHGIKQSEQILFTQKYGGWMGRMKAMAVRVGGVTTGMSLRGMSKFGSLLDATENVQSMRAAGGSWGGMFTAHGNQSPWVAKARLLGKMGTNWFHGRDMMSSAASGGSARTATARQMMLAGGGLMVGKSMLFDRHRRRRY